MADLQATINVKALLDIDSDGAVKKVESDFKKIKPKVKPDVDTSGINKALKDQHINIDIDGNFGEFLAEMKNSVKEIKNAFNSIDFDSLNKSMKASALRAEKDMIGVYQRLEKTKEPFYKQLDKVRIPDARAKASGVIESLFKENKISEDVYKNFNKYSEELRKTLSKPPADFDYTKELKNLKSHLRMNLRDIEGVNLKDLINDIFTDKDILEDEDFVKAKSQIDAINKEMSELKESFKLEDTGVVQVTLGFEELLGKVNAVKESLGSLKITGLDDTLKEVKDTLDEIDRRTRAALTVTEGGKEIVQTPVDQAQRIAEKTTDHLDKNTNVRKVNKNKTTTTPTPKATPKEQPKDNKEQTKTPVKEQPKVPEVPKSTKVEIDGLNASFSVMESHLERLVTLMKDFTDAMILPSSIRENQVKLSEDRIKKLTEEREASLNKYNEKLSNNVTEYEDKDEILRTITASRTITQDNPEGKKLRQTSALEKLVKSVDDKGNVPFNEGRQQDKDFISEGYDILKQYISLGGTLEDFFAAFQSKKTNPIASNEGLEKLFKRLEAEFAVPSRLAKEIEEETLNLSAKRAAYNASKAEENKVIEAKISEDARPSAEINENSVKAIVESTIKGIKDEQNPELTNALTSLKNVLEQKNEESKGEKKDVQTVIKAFEDAVGRISKELNEKKENVDNASEQLKTENESQKKAIADELNNLANALDSQVIGSTIADAITDKLNAFIATLNTSKDGNVASSLATLQKEIAGLTATLKGEFTTQKKNKRMEPEIFNTARDQVIQKAKEEFKKQGLSSLGFEATALKDGTGRIRAAVKDKDGKWQDYTADFDEHGNIVKYNYKDASKRKVEQYNRAEQEIMTSTSTSISGFKQQREAKRIQKALNLSESDYSINVDNKGRVNITDLRKKKDGSSERQSHSFVSPDEAIREFASKVSVKSTTISDNTKLRNEASKILENYQSNQDEAYRLLKEADAYNAQGFYSGDLRQNKAQIGKYTKSLGEYSLIDTKDLTPKEIQSIIRNYEGLSKYIESVKKELDLSKEKHGEILSPDDSSAADLKKQVDEFMRSNIDAQNDPRFQQRIEDINKQAENIVTTKDRDKLKRDLSSVETDIKRENLVGYKGMTRQDVLKKATKIEGKNLDELDVVYNQLAEYDRVGLFSGDFGSIKAGFDEKKKRLQELLKKTDKSDQDLRDIVDLYAELQEDNSKIKDAVKGLKTEKGTPLAEGSDKKSDTIKNVKDFIRNNVDASNKYSTELNELLKEANNAKTDTDIKAVNDKLNSWNKRIKSEKLVGYKGNSVRDIKAKVKEIRAVDFSSYDEDIQTSKDYRKLGKFNGVNPNYGVITKDRNELNTLLSKRNLSDAEARRAVDLYERLMKNIKIVQDGIKDAQSKYGNFTTSDSNDSVKLLNDIEEFYRKNVSECESFEKEIKSLRDAIKNVNTDSDLASAKENFESVKEKVRANRLERIQKPLTDDERTTIVNDLDEAKSKFMEQAGSKAFNYSLNGDNKVTIVVDVVNPDKSIQKTTYEFEDARDAARQFNDEVERANHQIKTTSTAKNSSEKVNAKYKTTDSVLKEVDKLETNGKSVAALEKVSSLIREIREEMSSLGEAHVFNSEEAEKYSNQLNEIINKYKQFEKLGDGEMFDGLDSLESAQVKARQYISSHFNGKMIGDFTGDSDVKGADGFARFAAKIEDVDGSVQKVSFRYSKATESMVADTTVLQKKLTGFAKIASDFKNKFANIFLYSVANMFDPMDMWYSIQNGIGVITELDSALVDLQKTTTMSKTSLQEFYEDSSESAKEMGVTTQQIINQASEWSRLGYGSKEEATSMSKLSSQFASISPDMDVDTATTGLVSTMKAFDIGVDNVKDGIMSKINAVGNSFALSNGDIIEGLSKSSAAMAAANNSFDETIALFTAGQEILQSSATVGQSLKTKIVFTYRNVCSEYI